MKTYDVEKVEVKNKKFDRDMTNKALISKDIEALQLYRERQKALAISKNLTTEVSNLKKDMSEIKDLLNKFIESKLAK